MPLISSSSIPATSDKDSFFSDKNGAQTHSRIFCNMLEHCMHGYPAAEEYIDTSHVKIISNLLHLLTGQADSKQQLWAWDLSL